ncbi:ech hydrogenase subunit A [Caldanaerobius fijiensis DSM 17918]|uniref:Ech hydrogenase subunit A n=1 Tax=Caldanaerobius fijiensis DSM 17918 TaxID=1121256 RepID=A0A1M4W3Z2_9THEO|nr:NADH-quinone oxidoreductase subunit L [Caldanaerobius fijiensis]SHE75929.1 ech hydrogenase subunit A [Caldanaerobius fijiensis DSM 17918]
MQAGLFINILLPFAIASIIYFVKNVKVRNILIIVTAGLVIMSSVYIWFEKPGRIPAGSIIGVPLDKIIEVMDFLLGLYILYISISLKKWYLVMLSLAQVIPMLIFEVIIGPNLEVKDALYIDNLSMVLNLIVSIIGTLIWVFSIRYMAEDEEHKKIYPSRQNRFFFVLILFIGAMNGLVLSNSLTWVYFFWEITTLSSFLLIGHDKTKDAINSAIRALLLNSFGGVAFVAAIIIAYYEYGTLDIQKIVALRPSGLLLEPIVLLCLAAFTKSAQIPFQSWLLGAMVAPTPVSALLHSSTMVKAGVYLILRLAPAFRDTWVSDMVAIFGAFTFVVASLFAIGQSNAKRILAYSTISNLGLIIAAAGINTPASIAAGILLIIFHAISKALLFLCVGTIEHHIGSRDIENMRGLFTKMPYTTVLTVIGLVTMLLPPFGVLLSKWLVIETASSNPLLVLLIAIGSALTVMYYTRWIGILLTGTASQDKVEKETEPPSISVPLTLLAIGSVLISLFVTNVFNVMVAPEVISYYKRIGIKASEGMLSMSIGAFNLFPVFLAMGVAMVLGLIFFRKSNVSATPYMCGETIKDYKYAKINNELQTVEEIVVRNYYFEDLVSERKLVKWVNAIAIILILMIFGVMIL